MSDLLGEGEELEERLQLKLGESETDGRKGRYGII